MHEVVGINYETGNRTFYFSTNKLDIKKGDELVVDTDKMKVDSVLKLF